MCCFPYFRIKLILILFYIILTVFDYHYLPPLHVSQSDAYKTGELFLLYKYMQAVITTRIFSLFLTLIQG